MKKRKRRQPTLKKFSSTTTNMESWKTMGEFPQYEVSDHGRVRNKRFRHKPCNGHVSVKGYVTFKLRNPNGKRLTREIQPLLLRAFKPKDHPSFFDRADHVNKNRSDNRLVNLRWSNACLNSLNSGKGYCWNARLNKWHVQATLAEKHIFNYFVAGTETTAKEHASRAKDTVYAVGERTYELLEEVLKISTGTSTLEQSLAHLQCPSAPASRKEFGRS